MDMVYSSGAASFRCANQKLAGCELTVDQGGFMAAKAFATSMEYGDYIYQERKRRFRPTRMPLACGANMLTSLDFETAWNVVISSSETGKGRLQRNPAGEIGLIDSLWMEYGDTHTDLHDINDLIRIKDRIINRCHQSATGNDSIVIIDWGCGAGHTLAQLNRWLQALNINCVQLYGFANEFHADWLKAPSNLTFILDVADNLPRYFKTRSIDFIYSIAGLYYLFIPEIEGSEYDMLEFFRKNHFDNRLFKNYAHTEKHLEALSTIMKNDGELLIDLPVHVIDIDYSLLQSDNRHYRTLRNPEKYGEHAYVLVPNRTTPYTRSYEL